jgi:hypothetical protein
MIPEPQRTYVLELLSVLGPAAEDLVLAGAQAMKFALDKARATKDLDFVLDVIAIRQNPCGWQRFLRGWGIPLSKEHETFSLRRTFRTAGRRCA